MWKYPEDATAPVLTAREHIASSHAGGELRLPETAVLFYMHSGEEFTRREYPSHLLTEKLPRFLRGCPVYQIDSYNRLCFLDGGCGAPHAADTLETLAALGVQNVVTIGMFGAFGDGLKSGDILIPSKAFVEEGTSLHYYESIDDAEPDSSLHQRAMQAIPGARSLPIVSTDAVYRQTFFKEKCWREKGAVGVDMETSALFSVGAYLGVRVVSILIASDQHPRQEGDSPWQWTMTPETRSAFFAACLKFARQL